jgi:hypothetical protein
MPPIRQPSFSDILEDLARAAYYDADDEAASSRAATTPT